MATTSDELLTWCRSHAGFLYVLFVCISINQEMMYASPTEASQTPTYQESTSSVSAAQTPACHALNYQKLTYHAPALRRPV